MRRTGVPKMLLPPLVNGRIIKRYKRFLADVLLDSGEQVTAHCPNTGAMTGCWRPGAPVQLSHNDNPKRKLAWTLERVDMGKGWIGVHTGRVNRVIGEAIRAQRLGPLAGYGDLHYEPRFAARGYPVSRFDLLLRGPGKADTYVEVKNATLLVDDCVQFPDAVTKRGRKHLQLLARAARQGHRAVIVYAVNRPEGRFFAPAAHIDPRYSQALERAIASGVEVLAVRLCHRTRSIDVCAWARHVQPEQPNDHDGL